MVTDTLLPPVSGGECWLTWIHFAIVLELIDRFSLFLVSIWIEDEPVRWFLLKDTYSSDGRAISYRQNQNKKRQTLEGDLSRIGTKVAALVLSLVRGQQSVLRQVEERTNKRAFFLFLSVEMLASIKHADTSFSRSGVSLLLASYLLNRPQLLAFSFSFVLSFSRIVSLARNQNNLGDSVTPDQFPSPGLWNRPSSLSNSIHFHWSRMPRCHLLPYWSVLVTPILPIQSGRLAQLFLDQMKWPRDILDFNFDL